MANPQGQQSAPLDAFLGLLTNISPESIPEGGSPLNWDCDFIVGDVFTRPGLVALYQNEVDMSSFVALENGMPDQTGNSFYSNVSLTSWQCGHWEYVAGQNAYVSFSFRLPDSVPASASIVLELFCADSTAGHTVNLQTSDAVVSTGSLNVGSLTSASAQTFTTTTTAYQRKTLTFAVQSTLVADGILIVKVATQTTGTAPTSNIMMLAYLGGIIS